MMTRARGRSPHSTNPSASVALGANTSDFQSDADAAFAAGASPGEVVGALIPAGPTVGVAKLVLAAPAPSAWPFGTTQTRDSMRLNRSDRNHLLLTPDN